MSLPTMNDAHVDQLLTNLLIGYKNNKHIYYDVFPVIDTDGVESGSYGLFTQADQFRNEAETISAGGPYPMGGFRVSTDTYSTIEKGIGTDLPDRTLANASGAFKKKMRLAKARWVADRVELCWELRLAAAIFTTGVWGTDDTTATDWDDYINSTPILDINNAIYTIEGATGETPNTLILGMEVWKDLKQNTGMLDFLGAQERGLISKAAAEQAFFEDVEGGRILVGKSIYNTANEGQTASYSKAWGQNALLLYVESANPDPYTASAGYYFESRGFQAKTWREGGRDTEFFRGSSIRDHKVTGANLGYMFSGIVS